MARVILRDKNQNNLAVYLHYKYKANPKNKVFANKLK